MSQLDTARKFHNSHESATQESHASIEVTPLREGRVQIVAEQSTKKWNGKKWHTDTVIFSLSAEQAAKLREALS